MRTLLLRVAGSAVMALGLTAGGLAGQQGTVAGRVIDQASSQPIVAARVQVLGTNLAGLTNAEGRFRFAEVTPGTVTIRVVALGYAAVNQTAAVQAGQTVTVDFALALTPFTLDEFVVTATGEQSRREIGNAISTVDVSELALNAPISNMGDLLAARAPSVVVLPANLTGGGARVRIRGNSSLSLSNNPIYIVDGVRVWSDVNSSSIGIGGTNPSRVNDLNPEDIESIDVVRGPSAATLYGTDAANGVIVIKTRRGKAGRPTWNAYLEQGFIEDYNDYPIAYRGWRNTSTVSNTTQCLLSQVVAGSCTQDSVSGFNLFEDPDASPNGTGHRQQYGLQVSGGTETVQYFLAGEWEDETGYLQLPAFAQQRLMEERGYSEIPEEIMRPNALTRTNLRANVSSQIGEKFDVAISTGFVTSSGRLPQTDNNTTGLLSNAYGGPGFKGNIVNPAGTGARENYGYRLYTPDEFFSETVSQSINRTIMSGTGNYRPNTWLSLRGVLGMDFTSRVDTDICRRDECVPFTGDFPFTVGFKADNRTTNTVWTGDFSGSANYTLSDAIRARTTAGTQYVKERFNRNGGFSYDLPPGSTTVTSGAVPSAEETTTETATLGYFAEQWFGWRDRLFLTLAVRSDRNNAFGQNFERVYYPKAALSWVASEEPWFPQASWLTNFRLRGAYGASGRQPGPNDAIAFYTPSTTAIEGQDVPSVVFSAPGNTELKPERSVELEMGFDASLFASRLNLELTYFDKRSEDALVSRPLPPSLGVAASRFENLGEIRNNGWEAVVNAIIIDSRDFGWDLTLGASTLSNEIVSLGDVPPIRGTTISNLEGSPLNAYWLRPYTYADANGDGIIALSEIEVGDTAVFVGYSQPRHELSIFTGFDLFQKKVRIQTNWDYKGGYYQLNGTERIRCESRLNCRGDVDPTAPLDEQARAVAVRQHSSRTQFGYVEEADFLRLRELSATWNLPTAWARVIRASNAAVTVGGRNLALFTGYTGLDPESGYFATDSGTQSDFQTAPPPTYWTFRVNLTF